MKNSIEFEQRISRTCELAFQRRKNLGQALQDCAGLFPTLAVSKFFEYDHQRTEQWIESAKPESHRYIFRNTSYHSSFPLSTWEFYEEERKSIFTHTTSVGQRICLLGVPSLAPLLGESNNNGPHILIDLRAKAPDSNQNLISLKWDVNTLSGNEFSRAFDVCFMDPPWYMPSFVRWVDIAVSYCRKGGTVVFALLGELTRPSAVCDREAILQHCRAKGLNIEIYKDFILYDVPTFERHMLWRAGIPPVPWKRADLVVAKLDKPDSTQHGILPGQPIPPYGQAEVSGVMVDIVLDRYVSKSDHLILEPAGGYWMETPSRRAHGMSQCNVFTSNGARFISPKPLDLLSALKNLEADPKLISEYRLRSLGFPADVFGRPAINLRQVNSGLD